MSVHVYVDGLNYDCGYIRHTFGLLVSGCIHIRIFMFMSIYQMIVEGILILKLSPLNGCVVWLLKFFHAKWLICCGVEGQRYVCVCVCWLCYSLWLLIVTNYKDSYKVVICIQYSYPWFGTTISPNFKGQAV